MKQVEDYIPGRKVSRLVLGLYIGMKEWAIQRCSEAPAKKKYSSTLGTIEKRLYRIPEAAVYLGIPEKSLYKMIWQGRLPFVVRYGRMIWCEKQGMDKWIAENTQQVRF